MRLPLLFLTVLGATALLAGCGASAESTDGKDDHLDGERRPNEAAAPSDPTVGVWALDSEPMNGELALLALDAAQFAGVVHETFVASDSKAGAAMAEAAPVQSDVSLTGAVSPGGKSGDAGFSIESQTATHSFTFALEGDRLRVTRDDGLVSYYTRSYRLYCQLARPGREATMILEIGSKQTLHGVNGDGVRLPAPGSYPVSRRSQELFDDHTYALEGDTRTGKVIVRLPWSTMNQPRLQGAVTLVPAGQAEESASPTPITCERIVGG